LATSLYGWWMFNSMVSHYFRGGNMWKGRRYKPLEGGRSYPQP
jgi:hypothetical protein